MRDSGSSLSFFVVAYCLRPCCDVVGPEVSFTCAMHSLSCYNGLFVTSIGRARCRRTVQGRGLRTSRPGDSEGALSRYHQGPPGKGRGKYIFVSSALPHHPRSIASRPCYYGRIVIVQEASDTVPKFVSMHCDDNTSHMDGPTTPQTHRITRSG